MDHEYERKGACNLFMFFEPLRGWRRVWVTGQRRKTEWACCVKRLLEEDYPDAKKVLLEYMQALRTNPTPGPLLAKLKDITPDPERALAEHLTDLAAPAPRPKQR